MNEVGRAIVAFVTAIIGLATLSVVLSKSAQTSGVIGAAGSALSGVIGAAVAPVTGGSAGGLFGGLANSIVGGNPIGSNFLTGG